MGLLAALFIAFEIYGPSIRGPFLFDDRYLPFFLPGWSQAPLSQWLAGVRPLLMFTYWLNFQQSQTDPFWYHVLNVLFHTGASILTWLILERILELASVANPIRRILALFGGLLFLVHPIQTESVAYVASRSENLSVLLFDAAFAIFLYRRSIAIRIPTAIAVVLVYLLASSTKEHAVVLPALLLLTDYWWNPGFSFEGIRRNYKLYLPIAIGALLGGWWVSRVLSHAATAGFGMKDLPWYEYFFSQCRAIWIYLRMFVLPFGQNVDHEFAVSRNILDHGAIAGLIALIAVSIAAWFWRRRFPIASYGWFAFLILIAPTSSFVPIQDLLVERRLYLPFIGLLLICCDVLRRLRVSRTALAGTLAGVIAVFAILTYNRNQVWGDSLALWKDSTTKSPNKSRPRFQLAYAYYAEGQCAEAAKQYRQASELEKPDYSLYVDWALANDCAGQPDTALDHLHKAVALDPTAHAWALIGMVYAKRNERGPALEALDKAQLLDPNFQPTYVYRGNVYMLSGDSANAAVQFRRAIELNPTDMAARNGLNLATRQVTPRL